MTSNQRRPGFRLPWASESEAAEAEAADAAAEKRATDAAAEAVAKDAAAPARDATDAAADGRHRRAETPLPLPRPPPSQPPRRRRPPRSTPEPAATRRRAAGRSSGCSGAGRRDLGRLHARPGRGHAPRGRGDPPVRPVRPARPRPRSGFARSRPTRATPRGAQGDAPRPTWPASASGRTAERSGSSTRPSSASSRRRAQLDQQLAAETTRAEAEAKALRDRVEAYERELDAYHAQLSDIADPAAFAAAAKRMPAPPQLGGDVQAARDTRRRGHADSARGRPAEPPTPNATCDAADVHPAEEEVLAARLAELDATLAPDADRSQRFQRGRRPAGRRVGRADLDRDPRQGSRQLRRHHRLPAGARRRRRHRRRQPQPRPDRRVRLPSDPPDRLRRRDGDLEARGRRGDDRAAAPTVGCGSRSTARADLRTAASVVESLTSALTVRSTPPPAAPERRAIG